MTDKILTEGEYRVGISFNPSNNPAVDKAKSTIASLIDDMYVLINDEAPGDGVAYAAVEYLEIAGMLMVKALTKPERVYGKRPLDETLARMLEELAKEHAYQV